MVCAKCLACRRYSVKVAVAVVTRSSTGTCLTIYNPFFGAFFHGGMAGVCVFVFNAVDFFVLLQKLSMFIMNKTFHTDEPGERNEIQS